MRRIIVLGILGLLWLSPLGAMAQPAPAPEGNPAAQPADQDPLGPPTDRGIRLTPSMARSLSRLFVQEALVREMQMDAAKADQATEAVARRLMALAHATDGKGNELVEYAVTRLIEREATKSEGDPNLPPDFAQGLGERLLPMVPAVKDLVRGVGADVIPMLPFKSQMKLSAGMIAAGTALDAFEKNMQRWANGEAAPNENPFEPGGGASSLDQKDASGQSVALKQAQSTAEREANREETLKSVWSGYLEELKKYYGFDAAQSATGEAILREYLERGRIMSKDPSWRNRFYQVRLWQGLIGRSRTPGMGFFGQILQQEMTAALKPMDALGDEFRMRLEEIPTQAQRTAAETRIMEALASNGYVPGQEGK